MRIVVVGGVAGGMTCAARARRLDEQAEIIVLDRGRVAERGRHVDLIEVDGPYRRLVTA